jgi:hypothetical protein
MVASARQVSIGGLDADRDLAIDKKANHTWREELWSTMRVFVESYIDAENGLKKHDGCAFRLNQIWEEKGRPVTGGALKNALEDSNRNNFRLEWAFWFASQDQDIARLLGMHVKPEKTPEQLLADQETAMREVLTHKQVEQVKRRARTL